MAEEKGMITQNDLDRILTVYSNVHRDNDENEKKGELSGKIILSQAELDSVMAKSISKYGQDNSDIIKLPKPESSDEDAAQIRAMKIAARKAHSAQILAKVQAESPRQIIVSYGNCVKNNSEIDKLKEGDIIDLDRKSNGTMKVYVDGHLFAEGIPVQKPGSASIQLIKLASKESR